MVEVTSSLASARPKLCLYLGDCSIYTRVGNGLRLGQFLRVEAELAPSALWSGTCWWSLEDFSSFFEGVLLFFFGFAESLHCLTVLLRSFQVGMSELMSLPFLPSHVHEFILVGDHVSLVQFMDRNQFDMLSPLVPPFSLLPKPMPIQQRP